MTPWTPKQKRFLLSKGSPLSEKQKEKVKHEPATAHKRKKTKR